MNVHKIFPEKVWAEFYFFNQTSGALEDPKSRLSKAGSTFLGRKDWHLREMATVGMGIVLQKDLT